MDLDEKYREMFENMKSLAKDLISKLKVNSP